MGIIRVTLYLLSAVILWQMGKRFFRSMTSSVEEEQQPVSPPFQKHGMMVKCAYCGLHIPKQEALDQDEVFFCCEEHRKAFITHQK